MPPTDSVHIDILMTPAGAQRCHVSLTTGCIQPGVSSFSLSGFSPGIHATRHLTRSGDSRGKGTVSTLKSDTLHMEHPRGVTFIISRNIETLMGELLGLEQDYKYIFTLLVYISVNTTI